jgi:mannose-6-phosphate isomerase
MTSGRFADEGLLFVEGSGELLVKWLLEAACPLWSTRGVDAADGGFQEALTLSGNASDQARRARVQPRQVFAFATASSLGWKGDAESVVARGLRYFLSRYRRADGLYRTLIASDGRPIDERALLYDQSFALLGFAAAVPLLDRSFGIVAEGESLRRALSLHLKRSGAGFETGLPHSIPLLSNPHMHLLEASLEWLDVGGGPEWQSLADEVGELALRHFIDPATRMLHESFDGSWNRTADLAGRLVEPGHQFEWAWMLMRWEPGRAEVREAALRLIDVADRYGVHGGVAVNAIVNDTSIHDGSARLWPQTERLRAAALAARLYGDSRHWKMTGEAVRSLLDYLATDVPGLWYDRRAASGEFVREIVPAGNLYHIVGAIRELVALLRSAGKRLGRAALSSPRQERSKTGCAVTALTF